MSGQGECHEGYLPCYRDCCERGVSFCNHEDERCHTCLWRECGNLNLLPWECDGFCLKRQHQQNYTVVTGMLQKAQQELSNLVSPSYMYASYVLGITVVLLCSLLIMMKVKNNRSNSQLKDDQSSISTDTDESKDEAKTIPATLPNPANLCNLGRESSQPLLQPAPVSTTPSFSARVQDRQTLPSSPQASPLAEQGLGQHPHHGVCRDHRLDGIAPTSSDTRSDMCISSSHHPRSGNSYYSQ